MFASWQCIAKSKNLHSKSFHPGSHPFSLTVNPIKLETGLRPNSAGIPYTLVLRMEAIGFPTFGLRL